MNMPQMNVGLSFVAVAVGLSFVLWQRNSNILPSPKKKKSNISHKY